MRTALLWLALIALGLRAAWAADPAPTPYPQILVTFKQAQTASPQPPGARVKYLSNASSTYAASPKVDRDVRAIAHEQGLRQVDAWPITPLGVHCVVFEVTGPRTVQDVLKTLSADPRVESAQPMQIFDVLTSDQTAKAVAANASVSTNEPGVALSGHGYDDPYIKLQHSVREMQLEAAQRLASGRGVDIAVIDTGIDVHHPELAG